MLASLSDSLFGSVTPSELVVEIFLAFVFGWLGWRISRSFAAARGVTPWRLPSLVWAVICFLFMVIGLVLELVAQMTTRTGSVSNPPPGNGRGPGYGAGGFGQVPPGYGQAPPPYGQQPGYGQPPPPYGQAPGYGQGPPPPFGQRPSSPAAPGYGQQPGSTQAEPTSTEQPAWPGAVPAQAAAAEDEPAPPVRLPTPPPGRDGKPALFGWYADVTRRHELRYWDGRGWTQFVRDAGVAAVDPV